ncbi:hypothetical protein AM1_4014 [Acaryochloris marina MBIC11017]|uniref:Uncharacterized protein n=2 Tax=Acaryochloris marina TaxID=155978 RepID=B0C9I4_ACAM1|nr:hypothetical protein AM1_4014 [Acaryochloris marina MBIC11017]
MVFWVIHHLICVLTIFSIMKKNKSTSLSSNPREGSLRKKLQHKIILNLMQLPAYEFSKEQKEIFKQSLCFDIQQNIKDSDEREDWHPYNDEFQDLPTLESNRQQKFVKIILTMMPKKDLFILLVSCVSFVGVLLKKVTPVIPNQIIAIFLISFYASYPFAVDRIISFRRKYINTNRKRKKILEKVDGYIYLSENYLHGDEINKKANLISEKIIKDDIADLDYRLKEFNILRVFMPSFLCILFLYFIDDNSWSHILKFIEVIVEFVGAGNFSVVSDLNKERLLIFFLFPILTALLRDLFISSLRKDNRIFRQSLVILKMCRPIA